MRLAIAIAIVASTAAAQPEVSLRLTATSDARDVLSAFDRTLVATEGGLVVLHDNAVERVLGAADGLPGDRMRSLSATDDGVWVGAVEGVALLDRDLRVVRTLPLQRARRVVAFAGSTFVATYGSGLFRLDPAGPTHIELGDPGAYERITDLLVQNGELWVATAGAGVLRLGPDLHRRGWIHRANGLADDSVWALRLEGGRVIALTFAGANEIVNGNIDRRGPIARASERLPIHDVRALVRDGDAILLGTWGAGVWRVDGARPRRIAPQTANVNALAPGWIAHEGGLSRTTGEPVLAGGMPSGDATSLVRGLGALWIGTFDAGLVRVRGESVEPQREAHERWGLDRRINDLAFTQGRLWIATDRGLWWHDGRIFSRVDDPQGPGIGHVNALHVDAQGNLWVAASSVLCRFARDRWRAWGSTDEVPIAQLHAITTDGAGRVWVGSLHGLYELDPASGRFTRHGVASRALPVDWVTALVPWEGGVMAGTYHGGLAIGDGEHWRAIREEDGLPSGWVNPHALAVRGGDVWIGTLERGLVTGRPGTWSHLGTTQGLPSDDVTDVLVERDAVWVATRGGVVRLNDH